MTPVDALVRVWTEWQQEPHFPFSPDHCLNGTRVAIEVLRRFGILAKPISVRMFVFNRFGFELYGADVPPDEWPEHAWSVGVDPTREHPGTGWNGHLVCGTADWTLDISAAQFHRPGKIHMPGPLVMPTTLPLDGHALFSDDKGQVIVIGRVPKNAEWRSAAGWQFQRNVAHVKQIAPRVAAVIAADEQAAAERSGR